MDTGDHISGKNKKPKDKYKKVNNTNKRQGYEGAIINYGTHSAVV